MRTLLIVLTLVISVALIGQERHQVDWKPCSDFTDQFKAQVEKFNAEHHNGFSVMLSCTYGGDPSRKKQPQQKVLLTAPEIEQLHVLRRIEDAAFDEMGKYEKHLYRAHHIVEPNINDPCYHFVGIMIDTDYITVDPNPMMPQDDCPVKSAEQK